MSLQKLADYCDRRSQEENVGDRPQRMYWVECDYFNKLWVVAILRCFWREAHEYEGSDDRTHFAPAGWSESYRTRLVSEAETEEEAIRKLEEALGL